MSATVGNVWHQGRGLATSLRSDWATPRKIFEMLDQEFHFTLDVCATAETACCKEFYDKDQDALGRIWVPTNGGAVWCNPEYGRKIGFWIEKAYRETCGLKRGITIVMLLPARTDTRWFFSYILNKAEIRFIQGRLCFDDNPRKQAPFPSMIVVFRPEDVR